MNRSWMLAAIALTTLATADDLDLARSLQDSFDRCTSKVTASIIAGRTRAALDFAAHDRNPVFHYPMPDSLRAPAASPTLEDLSFAGALAPETLSDRADQTPLSAPELLRPMAWRPMLKHLCEWDYDETEGLLIAAARITGEMWGNDLARPLQEIATAYLHGDELWVKLEFRPELFWLPIGDFDRDGYPDLWAKIDPARYGPKLLAQIRDSYLSKPLSPEDTEQFFFELASDWYQGFQTVALEPDTTRPWPNAETEPEILAAMDGRAFTDPFVVMRSRPYGKFIYNVFLLGDAAPADVPADARNPIDAELQRWGGSWNAWSAILADFHADVRHRLDARPEELKGLMGREEFLFFRGDLDYLLSGDLRDQPDGRDPFPAIIDFHQQLQARGIDMLLVFIPTKAEVYPQWLSESAPPDAAPYVAPYGRKLLGELIDAGIDTVDLLPAFIQQRGGAEPLYMPQDTHWTHRGLRLAASLIARRVRDYPWLAGLNQPRIDYTIKPVTCTRRGDICDMLTDTEKIRYRPLSLQAQQIVAPDGALYVDDPQSPIVMLGDSFTGVFHFEDCKHAGLSAHVARELSLPIDLIMAQGSGPRIRGSLARRGHDEIDRKRLVIWTVVTRDLYNYWAPWKLIKLP